MAEQAAKGTDANQRTSSVGARKRVNVAFVIAVLLLGLADTTKTVWKRRLRAALSESGRVNMSGKALLLWLLDNY